MSTISSNKAPISQYRDTVRHLVYLIKKMGNKNNTHIFTFQFPHDTKQLLGLVCGKAGGGFVQE